MKIIDLLNKIANNEELPNKIKYNYKIFDYDGFSYIYKNKTFGEYNRLEEFISFSSVLNDEVEIIEEEKKIPEKLDLILDERFTNDELQAYIYETQEKVNQVIDYLKSKGE